MTVSSTTRSVSFSCNGSTHEFDFPFKIFEEGDIRVFIRDSDGVETELTYTTNFEVSNDAGNFNAGGTVTTVSYSTGARATYAYPSGNTLIIMRDLDRTQETDYVQNTKINMDTLENDLDRAMMILQEIDEVLLRALVGPIGDGSGLDLTLPLASVRASKVLGFDADGKPIAIAGTSDVLVSSFMDGFLSLSSAGDILDFLGLDPSIADITFGTVGDALRTSESAVEALNAIGVSAFMQTVLDDADQATALETLGAQTLNAKLTAIAGLSWAADKIILITGASSAAAITCTAFARTILDDSDAASVLSTLGISGTIPGDASVSQAKLKTSSGEVSTSVTANLTLPGGKYGFYPQTGVSAWTAGVVGIYLGLYSGTKAYSTNIGFSIGDTATAKAQQTYVTSSGEVFWLYLLRARATGKTISRFASPDHPCMGNGGKPLLKPHPFPDYDGTKQEIIVINPTAEQVKEIEAAMIRGEEEPDVDFLAALDKLFDVDEGAKVSWPEKAVTVGVLRYQDSDGNWQKASPDALRRQPDGTPIEVLKKVIPRPDGVKLAGLVAKAVAKGSR